MVLRRGRPLVGLATLLLGAAAGAAGCMPLLNATFAKRSTIRSGKNPQAVDRAGSARRPTFRIMTYNIAHGRGPAKVTPYRGMGFVLEEFGRNSRPSRSQLVANLDRIAALINVQRPDVVLLNEVDFDASWSHNIDQVAYLARRTGLKYTAYGTKWDFVSLFVQIHCGNAVLSRFPIEGKNRFFSGGFFAWLAGSYSFMDLVVWGPVPVNVLHQHFDGDAASLTRQGPGDRDPRLAAGSRGGAGRRDRRPQRGARPGAPPPGRRTGARDPDRPRPQALLEARARSGPPRRRRDGDQRPSQPSTTSSSARRCATTAALSPRWTTPTTDR